MTRYRVYIENVVSTVVEVEAESFDEALDLWYDSPDAPGSITIGAFGGVDVDDSEWNATEVYIDGEDEPVWREAR